jgi:hypothetical protein
MQQTTRFELRKQRQRIGAAYQTIDERGKAVQNDHCVFHCTQAARQTRDVSAQNMGRRRQQKDVLVASLRVELEALQTENVTQMRQASRKHAICSDQQHTRTQTEASSRKRIILSYLPTSAPRSYASVKRNSLYGAAERQQPTAAISNHANAGRWAKQCKSVEIALTQFRVVARLPRNATATTPYQAKRAVVSCNEVCTAMSHQRRAAHTSNAERTNTSDSHLGGSGSFEQVAPGASANESHGRMPVLVRQSATVCAGRA